MKKYSLKIKSIIWLAGLVLAGSANANLIVNGGFEDNSVASGNWGYFSAADVNGWEGSNVEIWHNLASAAPEGQQHAELNAHPYTGSVFSIFQSFATVVGQAYDVSFFYSARSSHDEAFSFTVGNLNNLLTDHVVGQWSVYSNSFIANADFTELRFTSTNSGTYGNLIDGVSVIADVPESSSIILFAIGLLSLSFFRRKMKS
jgi:hypothetical protein